MKHWIYIEARDVAEEGEGLMLSFADVRVDAVDETQAYQRGAAAMDALRTTTLDAGNTPDTYPLWSHFANGSKPLNDYVVEV